MQNKSLSEQIQDTAQDLRKDMLGLQREVIKKTIK